MKASLQTLTLDHFSMVTHISVSVSLLFCMLLGISRYLVFMDKMQGHILNNFSPVGSILCCIWKQSSVFVQGWYLGKCSLVLFWSEYVHNTALGTVHVLRGSLSVQKGGCFRWQGYYQSGYWAIFFQTQRIQPPLTCNFDICCFTISCVDSFSAQEYYWL